MKNQTFSFGKSSSSYQAYRKSIYMNDKEGNYRNQMEKSFKESKEYETLKNTVLGKNEKPQNINSNYFFKNFFINQMQKS